MSSLLRRPVARPARDGPAQDTPVRVHELGDTDRRELLELVDADPYVNAVISSRLRALDTLEPGRLGGVVLGARDGTGRLTGAAFCGGNLLPIGGGDAEWTALAHHLLGRRRACSSIVGRDTAVAGVWRVLAPVWGPARAVRATQPLLVLAAAEHTHPGDPRLRMIGSAELDAYLPAAAAMFTEELGVSPHECAGAGGYRGRVAALIRDGRSFGLADRTGRILFKADVGAISPHTCQVQGVWVRPELRGQGIGTAALAAVFSRALRHAPTVSLYVNDFNVPARRMYERLGMSQVATLATVLF